MFFWKLRNYLSEKLNITALAGRHAELQFSDDKLTILPGVEFAQQPPLPGGESGLFLHIPKSAGTTVIAILEAQMLENKTQYDRSVIRGHHPPIAITPAWQGAWSDMDDRSERFNQADLISGHFPFGVHTLLNRDYHYFTVIREPVAREISTYNYLFQTGAIEKDEPFESFAKRMVDNPQVRLIAGHTYMDGPCTQDTYDAAIRNLESFFRVYGPSEETDDVINVLIGLYGWKPVAYCSFNITKKKLVKDISDDLKAELAQKHAWDRQLHEHVKAHWVQFKAKYGIKNRVLSPNDEVLSISKDFSKTKAYDLVPFSTLK
jgi:hypothetical protein